MHPAVKAHIDGNLSIIRHCLAMIDAAMSAEELGHQSALDTRQLRHEQEKTGGDQVYLDEKQDAMIEQGISTLFEDMKAETTNGESEFQPAK